MSSPRFRSTPAARRLTRDRRVLAWLLAATMAALAATSLAERADAAPKKLEGRLEVVAMHLPDQEFAYSVLTSDKKRVKLKLEKPPKIKPGAEVRVSGDLAGDTLAVDAIEQTAPAPEAPDVPRRRILVMLVEWTAPDAVTQARAQNQFGAVDDAWFDEVSAGQLRTEATATPWMRISPSSCTDYYTVMSRAQEAARQRGYDPSAYDHEVVYFPWDSACSSWAGRAQVNGRYIWLNGYISGRETVHELGHNLGLGHANTLECSDGAGKQVTLNAGDAGCVHHEYGDLFDAMGSSSLVGHFNAGQKHALGWLDGRVQTVLADATVALSPLESRTGLAAAVIPTATRDYWIEYRRPIGVDAFLTGYPKATDGVLIHSMPGWYGTHLLDERPDGSRSFTDAALAAGVSWTTPEGIVIRVDSATGTEARVTVTMPKTTNLVRNPSFETDLSGWGSFGGTLSRVALADAPDGSHAARAAWASGNLFTISDTQGGATPTVASTTAGTTYVATAHVKAASSSSVGKPVQIILRELTPGGSVVRESITSAKLGSGFARIGVSAAAVSSGNTLGLRVVQTSAASGNAFFADLLTLRKAYTVMGVTEPGTLRTGLSRNMKRASRFSFASPSAVDVAGIRAHLDGAAATSGSQPVRAVVYRDAAGSPGELVARSNEVSIAAHRAAGWVTLSFPSPVRLTAGAYWIGLHSGGSTVVARYAGAPVSGALRFNADDYGDGSSNPFGSASSDSVQGAFQVIGG